jgi:hypothetical protein
MRTKLDTKLMRMMPHAYRNRINRTIAWIDKEDLRGFTGQGSLADCGETNPLKEEMERYFNISIDSLDYNFNYRFGYYKEYNTIFAFEVLEHCYNPLVFLETIKNLIDENGVIYLSTPRVWPQWLRSEYHFHEIPTDRLMWLFEEAGLKVVKKGKISLRGDWYHYLIGIRPILRGFWKTRIYKLKAI